MYICENNECIERIGEHIHHPLK